MIRILDWLSIIILATVAILGLLALNGCACPAGYANEGYSCLPPVTVPFR